MALQLPSFQRISFDEANPFLTGLKKGVETGYLPMEKQQALQKSIYENMVSKATVPYAGPKAFLEARHLEQENNALPLKYIMQYSKDPVAILTALLSGNAGKLGTNIANQMMSVSNAPSGLQAPPGYNMGNPAAEAAAPPAPEVVAPNRSSNSQSHLPITSNSLGVSAPPESKGLMEGFMDWLHSYRKNPREMLPPGHHATQATQKNPLRAVIEKNGIPTDEDFQHTIDSNNLNMTVAQLKAQMGY